MEPIDNFVMDEGVDAYGVRKTVTFEGDQAVTKLSYDAAPLLAQAHAERSATAGDRWGEMRKVGVIPMVVLNRINSTIPGQLDRTAAILGWLKANPRLVTFDKFLKA
jgi:pyocin large subunit-like protein